jgi:hypothetical protein
MDFTRMNEMNDMHELDELDELGELQADKFTTLDELGELVEDLDEYERQERVERKALNKRSKLVVAEQIDDTDSTETPKFTYPDNNSLLAEEVSAEALFRKATQFNFVQFNEQIDVPKHRPYNSPYSNEMLVDQLKLTSAQINSLCIAYYDAKTENVLSLYLLLLSLFLFYCRFSPT